MFQYVSRRLYQFLVNFLLDIFESRSVRKHMVCLLNDCEWEMVSGSWIWCCLTLNSCICKALSVWSLSYYHARENVAMKLKWEMAKRSNFYYRIMHSNGMPGPCFTLKNISQSILTFDFNFKMFVLVFGTSYFLKAY